MRLVYLLLLSSVFPGFSLYNFGFGGQTGFPLLIYPCVQIIIFTVLVYKFIKNKSLKVVLDQKIYLYFFFAYVLTTSIISPLLFQGTEVIIPRLGLSLASIGPLSLNLSIIGQLFYLLLNILTIVYISNHKSSAKQFSYSFDSSLDTFLYMVAVIPIFFLLWELISRLFGIYYPYEIILSNEFGLHAHSQSFGDGIYRFSSTFSEPSFFSLFSSGFSIFFLCRARRVLSYDFLMYTIYSIATLASTSTTGISAMIFGHIMVISSRIISGKEIANFKAKKLLIVAALFSILLIFAITFNIVELITLLIRYQFIEKITNESGLNRLGADQLSFIVLMKTYFIGAGIGANRPSSLLLYLASNTGLIGLFLFTLYLYHLVRKLTKNTSMTDFNFGYSYALSLLTVFFGMCVGVPDFNQPYLWFWIFLCELNITKRKSCLC
ncbi:hypothetical protein [Thermosynechococcus sp. FA-CM-4201]